MKHRGNSCRRHLGRCRRRQWGIYIRPRPHARPRNEPPSDVDSRRRTRQGHPRPLGRRLLRSHGHLSRRYDEHCPAKNRKERSERHVFALFHFVCILFLYICIAFLLIFVPLKEYYSASTPPSPKGNFQNSNFPKNQRNKKKTIVPGLCLTPSSPHGLCRIVFLCFFGFFGFFGNLEFWKIGILNLFISWDMLKFSISLEVDNTPNPPPPPKAISKIPIFQNSNFPKKPKKPKKQKKQLCQDFASPPLPPIFCAELFFLFFWFLWFFWKIGTLENWNFESVDFLGYFKIFNFLGSRQYSH